jgi:uncharacterized protein (TIGR03083 family)
MCHPGRQAPTTLTAGQIAAVWPVVHAERRALARDLADLSFDQWNTRSLCSGWSVHEVLAHVVHTAKTTRMSFVCQFAAARANFDRYTQRGVDREQCRDPQDTLAELGSVAERTTTPPAPLDSRLVEMIVHGEDVRRPLRLKRSYPVAAVVRALDLQGQVSAAFGGGKSRVAGLELRATDTGYSHGSGPTVEGPALSLLLAVYGRDVALTELSGPGVVLLAERRSQ